MLPLWVWLSFTQMRDSTHAAFGKREDEVIFMRDDASASAASAAALACKGNGYQKGKWVPKKVHRPYLCYQPAQNPPTSISQQIAGLWQRGNTMRNQVQKLENFASIDDGIGKYNIEVIPHGAVKSAVGASPIGSTFVRGCECDWNANCLESKYKDASMIRDVTGYSIEDYPNNNRVNFKDKIPSDKVVAELNCTSSGDQCKTTKVSARLQYAWQPDKCQLSAFNAKAFCAALGDRQLVSIGDSLTAQLEGSIRAQIIAGGGDCWKNLVFIRNNWLCDERSKFGLECSNIKLQGDEKLEAYADVNCDDAKFFWEAGPTMCNTGETYKWNASHVLMLNVGAWYFMGLENYEAHMGRVANVVKWWRSATSPPQVIYRTTFPAHPQCWKGAAKTERGREEEGLEPTPTEYQWASFKKMNEIAIRAMVAVPGVRILDLYDVLDQRPDAHIGSTCARVNQYGDMGGDCLHWCFPGPLDVAGQVLQRMLENGELGNS